MLRIVLPVIAFACLTGTVRCSLDQAAGVAAGAAAPAGAQSLTAAEPAPTIAAPAAKPTTATTKDTTAPATDWQRDGYVPLPKAAATADQPAAVAAAAPAPQQAELPPANIFGSFTTDSGAATPDPTGTNVFADPKYAPAAVQAAYEALNPTPESVLPTTTAIAPTGPTAGGLNPAAAAAAGPGAMGGDVPFGAAAASGGAAGAGAAAGPGGVMSDSVFANQAGGFSNRYVPSVGTATSANDIVVKMIFAAPEPQVAASGDALRQMMSGITNIPADRIYVYQTRTITSATGQPSLDLQLLFKNNNDVERSRVQSAFNNRDLMTGFIGDVAKRLRLQIVPGSIKTSSAVNDGGAAAGAAGAMPGMNPGALGVNGNMMPGMGMMPQLPATAAAAAAQPAAAAAPGTNAADRTAVSVGMQVAVLLLSVLLL